jgi:hypothetical protein
LLPGAHKSVEVQGRRGRFQGKLFNEVCFGEGRAPALYAARKRAVHTTGSSNVVREVTQKWLLTRRASVALSAQKKTDHPSHNDMINIVVDKPTAVR